MYSRLQIHPTHVRWQMHVLNISKRKHNKETCKQFELRFVKVQFLLFIQFF